MSLLRYARTALLRMSGKKRLFMMSVVEPGTNGANIKMALAS